MTAARIVALCTVCVLAGCAAPAPEPEPRPITDQTMGGKFGTAPAGTVVTGGSSVDFRSNLLSGTSSSSGFGCVPGRGVLQRGDLICPGQGG